ncbi:MAG: substrate-binding domain-containing protein [Alphaproteobacteria bacterium]|nr:substrate-binding domain-containing protein [Alphaproteobacteria bacterium]MBU1559610.1 substrate-binding domain-containing protein [Alphaproteobacteria bacterium]MBU2304391.1 substrate-binding domain-containing protein [Alphaproteobacteria bacterium]MBU2367176.1 substrate-binding domain-containing protein [Alphaproteobacteria bacterium]
MNTKKLFTLGLSAALLASTVATGNAWAQDDIMAGTDLTKACKIGFSQGTLNHPWRVAMVEGNKAWAAENLPNVELIVTDGQNASAKQVADVESLMAQGIDVLMISPLTSQALTPIVADVMAAGIPVVALDRSVNTDVTSYITAQNEPIARTAGEFFVKQLGGKGNIVQIEGTAGASAAAERKSGFEEVIAQHPDMKIIATQNADFLRENATKFMEDSLQRFGPGEIQGVYAHNDEMALGAIAAIEAAGRQDEIMVTGLDGQNNAIQAVKDGKMFATFTFPFVAPEGIQYAYKLCAGEEVPANVILDSHTIDASNVDEWIGKGF